MTNLAIDARLRRIVDALGQGKVDQIVVAILDADVVQFEVPVTVSYLVQLA